MEKAAVFEKVSEERFINDFTETFPNYAGPDPKAVYDGIVMPKRATTGSAGYDFRTTVDFKLMPGESIKIPTGIRVRMREDYFLMIAPRSGLGFKYRLQLNNTVGIIDSDYYMSENEGHIFVKITNDSKEGKAVELKRNDAFAQGIFLKYGITEDDDAQSLRTGGIGSTDNSGK